ncbi:MAG: HEPN domain-containing protein [Acidimicrobiales bacterium]
MASPEAVGGPLDAAFADALRRLSKLYIPTRYADALPGGDPADKFTDADANEAIADAELVLAEVDDVWRQVVAGQQEAEG